MPPSSDAYWLALRRVKGIGPRIARLLLERFQSPEQVFAQRESALVEAGISRSVAHNIAGFDEYAAIDRELCELQRVDGRLIRWSDPEYPAALKHIADPPPFLFVRGTMPVSGPPCVAVVGARAASEAGLRMGRRFGFELAAKGFAVVSGLARGIDGEAHQGALDAGGTTIAVMGCGIDVIYPAEHRKLTESILANRGALLSELPVGTPPIGENFPTRNRILSGLSLGVVIVEAAERSGSLITARMALEQDRQVFAVPGSPVSGKSRGSNRLLKDGAKLVECVEDVIEDLAPQLASSAQTASPTPADGTAKKPELSQGPARGSPRVVSQSVSEDAKSIVDCLKDDERLHVDAIIEGSGLDAKTVLRFLLELELQGVVRQHPGKLFSRS
jgi:DNA processing protein